jgi:hypothetical protein
MTVWMRPRELSGASASSGSVMAADAVHQSRRRLAFTLMARRQRLARAPIMSNVVCLPEQQVDRLECQVITEAWGRIDRDEYAVVAAGCCWGSGRRGEGCLRGGTVLLIEQSSASASVRK